MASRKHHELYFKVDNRVAVSTVASKMRCSSKTWRSTRMVAITTSCVHAAACANEVAMVDMRVDRQILEEHLVFEATVDTAARLSTLKYSS